MLKKLNQFILNRAFDKKLIQFLKSRNIDIQLNKTGHTIHFPQPVTLRPSPSSDFSVFLQVFNEEQYLPVVHICLLNKINVSTILDLGANVGFTTIFLKQYFKKAKVFAVEPDQENFKTLVNNLSFLENTSLINAAIWRDNTYLNPSYEEQSDWGKTFSENLAVNDENRIEAITIQSIIDKNQLKFIDILKIDIEGAEKQVFEGSVEFLKLTKVIAIEVHENYISKDSITEQLRESGFILIESGELIIGINKICF